MSQGQSVLIVDDDESFAHIVALILGQDGFEVRTAHDGMHGYAAYFCDPTDWVVTDIQMPELNGLQMIHCIRVINPRVKTVYMSGEVDKYQTVLDQERLEFGAGVLRKPFTRTDLIEEIGAAARDTAWVSLPNRFGARRAPKED